MNAELLNELFANVDWLDIWLASQDTLIMVGVSLVFTIAFGLSLGVLLFLTSRQQLLDSPRLYRVLAFMTNLLRSLPFVILLIAMIPITVLLTGTSIGVAGVIPPLVIGATALFKVAHLVEGFAQAAHYVEQIRLLAHFELGVATVIVGYVALRYLMFFLPQRNTEMNNGMARQGAHR